MSMAQSLEHHHAELEANCPMSDVKRWRTVKAMVFALLIFAYGFVSMQFEADPTVTFAIGAALILVMWGAEVKEIEIASWFSMVFKNGTQADGRHNDKKGDE